MNHLVLSEEEAELRAADEQLGVLLSFYEDPYRSELLRLDPGFVAERREALAELRQALRAELAARDILPKQQDDDVSAWQFLVDRVQGLLRDEPLAVPLEEERKLLALCDRLLERGDYRSEALRQGEARTREAVETLKNADG